MKNCIKIIICLLLIAGASQTTEAQNKERIQRQAHLHKGKHHKPISDEDFELLCYFVEEVNFDSNKIIIIRAAGIGNNYFNCLQAAKLLELLSYDSSRLEALKFIAPHIIGNKNIDKIIEVFSFSSNKEEAIRILGKRGK